MEDPANHGRDYQAHHPANHGRDYRKELTANDFPVVLSRDFRKALSIDSI